MNLEGEEPRGRLLHEFSFISAGSAGLPDAGNAGNIVVLGVGEDSKVLLTDGGNINTVGRSKGDSGNLTIDFDRILVGPGAFLAAGSTGDFLQPGERAGNTGDITIAADVLRIEGGNIGSTALKNGDGGDVFLNVSKRLEVFGGPDILFRCCPAVLGGSITTDVRGGPETTGGNITISSPDFVILENGGKIIANAFEGQGGNIDITTKALLVSDDSTISASSELGVSGTVQVNAPDSDLTTNLETLSQDYLDAVELRNRCAEGPDESQFRVASRLLQGTPDGMLPSFTLASVPRIVASCQ